MQSTTPEIEVREDGKGNRAGKAKKIVEIVVEKPNEGGDEAT